ncbi:MAG: YigZ family protein [Rikenellaceae bacterium]
MDSYKTIEKSSEGLYKEKGSKFIAYAYPVESVDEIGEIVARLKKEYYDARHHCYAWRLGYDGKQTRANDDGEPSSTAGKPILGQLLSADITNVLVVVIRYFGGTKLGVSGLIRAYKEATIDALDNTAIVEREILSFVDVTFGYEQMNSVMKVIKDCEPKIVEQNFDNLSHIKLSICNARREILLKKMGDILGVIVEQEN